MAATSTQTPLYTALRLYWQIDCRHRGNSAGGGTAVFLGKRLYNPRHVTEKERLCTSVDELLVVSSSPCCLLREFTSDPF